MRKLYGSMLVCTSQQSEQLIALGIIPAGFMCYEWSAADSWEYSGEYVGQDNAIPAWTMEELNILIGANFPKYIVGGLPLLPKPDMYRNNEWLEEAHMMRYILYLPKKRIEFINGAQAYAALLEYLLINKELKIEEANMRMDAFITKPLKFNPMTVAMYEKKKKN